jgi:hypothetical protein
MSDQNSNDVLKNAFLQSTISEDSNYAVKAEDVQSNNGIDFSKHFFEAKVGSTYLIKFLPNPGGEPITHRSLYKNLPDPERKGKTFHYVSSGNAKTCLALDLFFELNALKKEGDAIAEKKIEKYMGNTNQGCCKIQVLQSPVAEEIGIIRMFAFSTFGPNASVANLINVKLNPTKEQLAQGYTKEDIFAIWGSDVMSLVCEETTYPGKGGQPAVKGRDFSKSAWLPKKQRGAIGILPDGKTHEFSTKDLVGGQVSAEVLPFFNAFVEQVCSEDYDIRNFFAYKEINDPKNSKETNDYLINVKKKLDEIIPVIREKSLNEIATYGKAAPASSAGKADKAKDIMADSVPDELAGSVMNAGAKTDVKAVKETKAVETKTKETPSEDSSEAENILNS